MAERRPPALRIGDLTTPLPIIQGGMGVGVSLSGLAGAVAAAGGIGVIACAGIGMAEPDFFQNFLAANTRALRAEIRRAKALSPQGVLGVNIMVALANFAELVTAAIDEGIDVIFSGAGLPLDLPHICGVAGARSWSRSSPQGARPGSSPGGGRTGTPILRTPSSSRGRGRAGIWASSWSRSTIRPMRWRCSSPMS